MDHKNKKKRTKKRKILRYHQIRVSEAYIFVIMSHKVDKETAHTMAGLGSTATAAVVTLPR